MFIRLEVPEDAERVLRARLGYAFRVFCAIYGHTPVIGKEQAQSCDVTIRYRGASCQHSIAGAPAVWLCRGYRVRSPREPAPAPVRYVREGLSTILHHEPENGDSPDWLGEIFEWISCADEYSVSARDRIGRPLHEATYAGRHGIDTRTPYAALAMRGLQREICRVVSRASELPQKPEGINGHAVIPTHDVDYFPISRAHTIGRLARNAVISCVMGDGPMLGLRQAAHAVRVALGAKDDPLDQIAPLAIEEQRQGFAASYYFLVLNAHRRDAHYSLEDTGVVETMRWLQARGMEIGLHGSFTSLFTSLDDPGGLKLEVRAMHRCRIVPRGSRQHWLRYTLDRLIPAVETAGLQYDASIGWSTRVGFRAGACFAFPPYDFSKEQAANFLELPLVAMDQALRAPGGGRVSDGREEQLFHEAAHLLSASRELCWGGITLLWHPAAFGSGWLSPEIGKTFWRLAAERRQWGDQWMTGAQFLDLARERYVQAGLLPAAAQARLNDLPLNQHSSPPAVEQTCRLSA